MLQWFSSVVTLGLDRCCILLLQWQREGGKLGSGCGGEPAAGEGAGGRHGWQRGRIPCSWGPGRVRSTSTVRVGAVRSCAFLLLLFGQTGWCGVVRTGATQDVFFFFFFYMGAGAGAGPCWWRASDALPESGALTSAWAGALGKAPIALGKGFAECNTWQRSLGKKIVGKAIFAECFLLGTRVSDTR
jgi:hypothetical protein